MYLLSISLDRRVDKLVSFVKNFVWERLQKRPEPSINTSTSNTLCVGLQRSVVLFSDRGAVLFTHAKHLVFFAISMISVPGKLDI